MTRTTHPVDSDRDMTRTGFATSMVAKTTEQEENVVARQGFTVLYLISIHLLILTSVIACRKMNSSRLVSQPLPPNMHMDPSTFFSKVTLRGNHAGFHDCPFPAGEVDCREVFSRPSERLPDSSPFVSVFWSFSKLVLRLTYLQRR
jgi:hypothetical protein